MYQLKIEHQSENQRKWTSCYVTEIVITCWNLKGCWEGTIFSIPSQVFLCLLKQIVFFHLHTYQYFVLCKSSDDPQACCWPHLLVQLVLMVQLCHTEIKTVWKLWLNVFPIYNLWSRGFLVTVSCYAGQKMPTFYGTWRFIIMFTRAHSL